MPRTQRKSQVKPKSPAHLAGRVQQLQQRLRELELPALLITNPRDIRYLTGFIGDDSWLLLRQRSAKVHLLSDFRFVEQIQREAPHAELVLRDGKMTEAFKALVKKLDLEKVGLQAAYVTLEQRRAIGKAIGMKRIAEADDKLLQQRAVKDAAEVAAIRKALGIQQEAYRRTLAFVEPGKSEAELAAYLEYQMRSLGADGPSFNTIVAVDANASLPHAIPGSTKVRQGSMILFDWGARLDGYCSDLTRVVAVGEMAPKIREIYGIVREAQQAAIAAIRPGVELVEVDRVARDHIAAAGYGEQFGHSLGHGIGLDIHEQPTLSKRSEGVLEKGQVVTVEPGIYLPGVGGVRIEDDVLVTGRGREVLSDLPSNLESAII